MEATARRSSLPKDVASFVGTTPISLSNMNVTLIEVDLVGGEVGGGVYATVTPSLSIGVVVGVVVCNVVDDVEVCVTVVVEDVPVVVVVEVTAVVVDVTVVDVIVVIGMVVVVVTAVVLLVVVTARQTLRVEKIQLMVPSQAFWAVRSLHCGAWVETDSPVGVIRGVSVVDATEPVEVLPWRRRRPIVDLSVASSQTKSMEFQVQSP